GRRRGWGGGGVEEGFGDRQPIRRTAGGRGLGRRQAGGGSRDQRSRLDNGYGPVPAGPQRPVSDRVRALTSVVVVGGGAVGLCVAESLATRGADVTVIERDLCGRGASAGHAGWITPSLAVPVPAPGVVGQSLRWLLNPDGPLWIRPTLSPAMLAWISQFLVSCTGRAYRRGLVVLQAIGERSPASFDALAGRGVRF